MNTMNNDNDNDNDSDRKSPPAVGREGLNKCIEGLNKYQYLISSAYCG